MGVLSRERAMGSPESGRTGVLYDIGSEVTVTPFLGIKE
jgi:hypothetical protein